MAYPPMALFQGNLTIWPPYKPKVHWTAVSGDEYSQSVLEFLAKYGAFVSKGLLRWPWMWSNRPPKLGVVMARLLAAAFAPTTSACSRVSVTQ